MAEVKIMTELSAQRILGKQRIISDTSVSHAGLRVTYIGYESAPGVPFVRFVGTEQEEEVAVISVNAMSPHQMSEAVIAFEAGEYNEAVRSGLSVQVPLDEVDNYTKRCLVNITLEEYTNSEGIEGCIGIASIAPAKVVTVGHTNIFSKKATSTTVAETA